ncbi:hypothetical protein CCR75_008114 [Bremia lactucae]|uniref:Uncharacterized protein n=1 Tax=Bremia lactucae TaxID=4779 RepID=A0A976FG09_BRELC|nr:hypothetical protein CCR75_008114 [Bremia lactucae]
MAAYFLQRKCVVLSYGTTSQLLWECSIDRPCTTSRGGEVQETGQQVPSQLDECIAVIRGHSSAYVHTRPQVRRNDAGAGDTPAAPKFSSPRSDSGDSSQRDPAATHGGAQTYWNPIEFKGKIAELRQRINGMTTPPDLHRDVRAVLDMA